MNILEIQDLVKHFPEVKAVDGISFSIRAGSCFGLLGPNGAGKTTSIEVIEGIQKRTSGEILYKGSRRGPSFKQEVGIQLQNTELPQYLSVRETLEFFRKLYERRADFAWLVEICRLEEIIDRDNWKISGGQKQRLLLAIALANDPDLVFLDEPTTGLDPQARRHLWEIVRQIQAQGKTVILTTHYMEEAQILCDEIAIMDHGKIVALGSPEELLRIHAQGSTIVLNGPIDEKALGGIACAWSREEDRIEIRTLTVNDCLRELIKHDVDLTGMTIRSQNLEDIFLILTGHTLRG
ncbi:MAG: ABC transporter ATP-binding protein [Spirochaetes bacterium]|nr:MAG: ABC transporter ATP-binding protein [Spirochaetota bacterium]